MSESTTQHKEVVVVSSSPESEPLVTELIVWPIHVSTSQIEVPLSLDPELSIPEPDSQPIPTSVKSFPLVPSHVEL